MAAAPSSQDSTTAPPLSARHWWAQAVGLMLFHLVALGAGRDTGLWLPALGLGLALVSWYGFWFAAFLAVDLFVVRLTTHAEHSLGLNALDSVLLAGQMAFSWWCFHVAAQGSRNLHDPRSATVFLLIVPGGVTALAACLQAALWKLLGPESPVAFGALAGMLGISRAVGCLAIAPALLVVATPLLRRARLTALPPVKPLDQFARETDWGERIELTGLCLANAVLTVSLVVLQAERGYPGWALWGISLLLVVWASLRQGLRGGIMTVTVGAVTALVQANALDGGADFRPLQGNLLAQISTALLVGASSGWLRASEERYRRVVGRIPVVLYSVRLPRSVPLMDSGTRQPDHKFRLTTGSQIIEQAVVTLVSQASRRLLGRPAAEAEGPFDRWLEHVDPGDHEVLLAAVSQLVLQRQPVSCEYRVVPGHFDSALAVKEPIPTVTWVRDTLAPHHGADGRLDGWDGVVQDITEARLLSNDLRRTNGMLQALVANLPTGVYFVQGPLGLPIRVNARARQLLGQREDVAAGLAHLSRIYRLHRPDGSEYPVDELPVTKALRWGMTCMADDLVVHRPDGRRVPLVTWAAPVDLGNLGQPEAAVWVLEDLTPLKQAESARSESEARLRATFDSMAEGLLLQDQNGTILECNPAAAAILNAEARQLVGQTWLGQDRECSRGNGTSFPADERPDRVALRTGQAVRNCIVGLKHDQGVRWLQVNCVPLPAQKRGAPSGPVARLATSFADITVHRQVQEELQKSQRLELMGRLASGTVHEFNNMLTALLGMAAIAHNSLPAEHPVRDDLNRIIDIGEQAADIAGQLLTFSKQHRSQPRVVDVNTVVVNTLTILKGVMPPGIRVEMKLAPSDLWVLADETQLKQVVMNLCLNARDAMPDGGVLSVQTLRLEQDDRTWIGLTVEDTGRGMDDVTLARIFEPFFTTKDSGTGLGLAVVQQIISRFGGHIDVWSRPGQGAHFEVWLHECPPPDTMRNEPCTQ